MKQHIFKTQVLVFLAILLIGNSSVLSQESDNLDVMIPLYQLPYTEWEGTFHWQPVVDANSKVGVTAIINPDNGPTTDSDTKINFKKGIKKLNQGKVKVYGYVPTGYFDPEKYIIGGLTESEIINAVKADIDLYYDQTQETDSYSLDGIFFDEASNSEAIEHKHLLKSLYNHVKQKNSSWDVVLNLGVQPAQTLLSEPCADILVTFENSFKSRGQMESNTGNAGQYAAMVHTVLDGNLNDAKTIVDDARSKNYGFVYVTNEIYYPPAEEPVGSNKWVVQDYKKNIFNGDNNPFDNLPSFWTEMIDYIQEGNLLANPDLPKTNTAYYIESKAYPDKVWHIPSSSVKDGDKLFVKNKTGGTNEQFILTDKGEGNFRIENIKTGKAADFYHNYTQQWNKHGGLQQQVKLIPAGNGYFYIECQDPRQNGNAVVAENENLNQTAKSANQSNQLFRFVEASGN